MHECRLCLEKDSNLPEVKMWWGCLDNEHFCCKRCEFYFSNYLNCPICVFNLEIAKYSTNLIYRLNFAQKISKFSKISEYNGLQSQYIHHFYKCGFRKVLQELAGLLWGTANRSAAFRFQLLQQVKKYQRRICRKKILILRKLNLPSDMIQCVMQF